jgi:hypothetical protein
MKRVLFLSLIFLSANCFAQKIHFSDKGNGWEMKTLIPNGPNINNWLAIHSYSYYDPSDTIINGINYQQLSLDFFIHEDSLNGKVYAARFDGCDSVEHLIYDYNLISGDTFRSYLCSDTLVYIVADVDTVIINGVYHKVWFMNGVPNINWNGSLLIIEGIGSLSSPMAPYFSVGEHLPEVICFRNQGNFPTYAGTRWPSSQLTICEMGIQDQGINHPGNARVIPNPVKSEGLIILPENISGTLRIYNCEGRIALFEHARNKKEISFGSQSLSAGMYYFHVTDERTLRSFSGKFITE